jgi:NTP pyrophosphatase (non-canonical NTP hydrolase)
MLSKQQNETAVIAMEEMAELIQVLSKAMRFGYTPGDTGKRLVQEMGDVLLLLELLQNTFGIEDDELQIAMDNKKSKLMAWSSLYE